MTARICESKLFIVSPQCSAKVCLLVSKGVNFFGVFFIYVDRGQRKSTVSATTYCKTSSPSQKALVSHINCECTEGITQHHLDARTSRQLHERRPRRLGTTLLRALPPFCRQRRTTTTAFVTLIPPVSTSCSDVWATFPPHL